jgi:hypothetical protein
MMHKELQRELEELVDEVAPPLIDLDQLDRLVLEDENPDAFDGECTAHSSCMPVFVSRFDWLPEG